MLFLPILFVKIYQINMKTKCYKAYMNIYIHPWYAMDVWLYMIITYVILGVFSKETSLMYPPLQIVKPYGSNITVLSEFEISYNFSEYIII